MTKAPLYAAVVCNYGGKPSAGLAQVDGVFVEYFEGGLRTTELGKSSGLAVVDAADFKHLGLDTLLERENNGTGQMGSGDNALNIVLILPPKADIHESTYAFERSRVRSVLV